MRKDTYKPSRSPLCISSGIAALLSFSLLAISAFAQTVEVKLPSGMTASANFQAGLPAQPAVLLLHGFLQTHHSPPMSSLANNLASKGYTVLNPTISLGLNKRSQSSPCEAAHTYTMDEEISEIGYWVTWLNKKGYKNIALAGFSSVGNLDVLLFNLQTRHPAIKASILISLNPLEVAQEEQKKIQRLMNSTQHKQNNRIGHFTLGYCQNNFAATDRAYLSYAQHDEINMLQLLQQTSIPTEIIFGADDAILPANWLSRIETHHGMPVTVTLIPNANHFFDGTSEFDLSEAVEQSLLKIGPQ